MNQISLAGIILLFGLFRANAQWSVMEDDTSKNAPYYLLHKFSPEEWRASNFASEEDLEWFRGAKYGMFIHFGLSSFVGRDLSWGPKWEGDFDTLQVRRLKEVGEWLESYGHTIYNTKGGPWHPGQWGGSTCQGNTVFLHLAGEAGKQLTFPSLKNKIMKATSLTGDKVHYDQNDNYLIISLEGVEMDPLSSIIELTMEKEIK